MTAPNAPADPPEIAALRAGLRSFDNDGGGAPLADAVRSLLTQYDDSIAQFAQTYGGVR